jgi:hypothetical protein
VAIPPARIVQEPTSLGKAYNEILTAMTIDTLAIVQVLRKRAFSEELAIGGVEAFREIDAGVLTTEADLREVETTLELKIEATTVSVKWTSYTGSSPRGLRSATHKSRASTFRDFFCKIDARKILPAHRPNG